MRRWVRPFIFALLLTGCEKDVGFSAVETAMLFDAIFEGRTTELKLALDRGVSPNIYQVGRGSLVYTAAASGNLEALRILIDAGVNVNARPGRGANPLIVAILGGRCEAARMLLMAGADPDVILSASEAANSALDEKFYNRTARELYFINIKSAYNLPESRKRCWAKAERFLINK